MYIQDWKKHLAIFNDQNFQLHINEDSWLRIEIQQSLVTALLNGQYEKSLQAYHLQQFYCRK